jgi:hypothetical protein
MEKNKIKNAFTDSAWITKNDSSTNVSSSHPIETTDPLLLVKAILNELQETNDADKENIKLKLLSWIKSMPPIKETMGNQEKIRDFIYEMF